MRNLPVRSTSAAAVCTIAAALALGSPNGDVRAEEAALPGPLATGFAARLASDSSSARWSAERELRLLPAGEVKLLEALAAHDEVPVRVAAVDVLAAWYRGNDVPRAEAARETIASLARVGGKGSTLAAARLDALVAEAERSIIESLGEYVDPVIVPT